MFSVQFVPYRFVSVNGSVHRSSTLLHLRKNFRTAHPHLDEISPHPAQLLLDRFSPFRFGFAPSPPQNFQNDSPTLISVHFLLVRPTFFRLVYFRFGPIRFVSFRSLLRFVSVKRSFKGLAHSLTSAKIPERLAHSRFVELFPH